MRRENVTGTSLLATPQSEYILTVQLKTLNKPRVREIHPATDLRCPHEPDTWQCQLLIQTFCVSAGSDIIIAYAGVGSC